MYDVRYIWMNECYLGDIQTKYIDYYMGLYVEILWSSSLCVVYSGNRVILVYIQHNVHRERYEKEGIPEIR